MKNILFLFAALLTLSSSALIKAEEGTYASVFGGVNWLENIKKNHHKFKFQTGYLVGGAVGYEWCNNIRAEAEFAYRNNKLRHGHWSHKDGNHQRHHQSWKGRNSVRTWSLLANLLYDFDMDSCGCSWLKPYLGFGIGYGNNKVVNDRWNEDNDCCHRGCKNRNGFAWQFIAGIAYPVTECFDLDIQYRYFQSHKHVRSNDLVFGGRFMF
jgi:opacity protein-like surface antigen